MTENEDLDTRVRLRLPVSEVRVGDWFVPLGACVAECTPSVASRSLWVLGLEDGQRIRTFRDREVVVLREDPDDDLVTDILTAIDGTPTRDVARRVVQLVREHDAKEALS